MSFYFLHGSDASDPDLVCPHCSRGLEVVRQEEPYDGDTQIKRCPECNREIQVETRIEVTYTASKVVKNEKEGSE
jgi:transposase-like protein